MTSSVVLRSSLCQKLVRRSTSRRNCVKCVTSYLASPGEWTAGQVVFHKMRCSGHVQMLVGALCVRRITPCFSVAPVYESLFYLDRFVLYFAVFVFAPSCPVSVMLFHALELSMRCVHLQLPFRSARQTVRARVLPAFGGCKDHRARSRPPQDT